MAFDIKNFYERNKDYYGDVPLEDVAKDAFTRSGMDQKYSYDDWKQQIGIAPIVEEDAYQRQVQKARMDTPGIFGELGRSLMRGVTQTVPQSIGKGIQWLNPDSGGIQAVEEAGKTIERFGDANVKRFPGITMSKAAEEAGDWNPRKWVASAGESIAQSVTPIIVGAAGAAIGGPVAGVAAGLGTLGGMFYAGTAEDTYRSAKEKGLSDEDAMNLANITGGVEAGGELVADLIPIKIFGGLGKAAKGSIIKSLTSRKPVKAMIGDVARTIVGEELTESGQQAIQTYAAEKYGVADQGVMESVAEVWGPTLITSLMFGAGGIGYNSAHRAKVRKALANPNVNPEERVNAVMEVTKAANDVDPTVGKNFFNQASRLLSENKPVIIDDDEFYNIGSIPAPGGITDKKRVAEIGDTPTPQPMTGPVTSELSNAGVVPKPKPAVVREIQPAEEPVQEYGPPPNIQSLVDSRRDVLAEDARMQQANKEPRGRRGLSMGGLAPTKRYQEAIKEVADKGTIPDVQDTLQAIRDDATERISGEKASEVGQEVQGNIAPLANPETVLPEQAGNAPAGEAPVEATPAEPVTQPIAGSEAGLKAGGKPLETADEVQAGEEPASISVEETFPSMTLPIEQIRKSLVDKLNERKENGDKLPVGLRNKTPEKYVEKMPERMARDWYSSIFETGATPNAKEKSQETQALLEQTPGKPPESEPVVPPSVSAVPSEQGLPASGREGGSLPLRYDPSTDKHNGEKLKPGDTLYDESGNTYRLDRNSGFILTADQIDSEGKPVGIKSFSVDPFDKARFKELYKAAPQIAPKADQPSAQTVAPPSGKAGVAEPANRVLQPVNLKDVDSPAQGQLNASVEGKKRSWQRVKALRERIKAEPLNGNRSGLRLELIKAEGAHNEWQRVEREAKEAIEKRANELGQTTIKPTSTEPAPQPKTKPKLSPVESMTGKKAKKQKMKQQTQQPSQSAPQTQQNARDEAQKAEGIQTPASKIEKSGLKPKGKAAAEKTGKAVYTAPDFSDSEKAKTTGIPATQARTEFASFTQAVKKSGHKIEFHDSLNDVPNGKAKSKAQSHEASTGRYVRAFYDRDTDTSHIITGRLDSMNDVVKVLCHESIGHSGLYKFMGSDLTPFLDFVLRHPGYGLDIKKVAKSRGIDFIGTEGRYQAAKEWFAEIAEKGDIQPTLLSRLVVAFKNALRRLGVKAEWLVGFSDKDVAEIIRGSRNAIIGEGAKYRDAGLIGKPVGEMATDYSDLPETDLRIDYSDSPQGQANQAAAAPFTGFENRTMAQIKTWLLKHGMDERWEKFAMWLYDDKKALLTVQKTLAPQPTFRDYNMLSRLMGSAITNEVKRLDRDYIKPLLQHMADNKLKTKDVEELAYAKHAPAFNLQMKRVNAKRYIDALIDNMTEAEARPYKERIDDIRSRFKKADPENSDLSVNDLRDEYVALLDGMAVEVAGKEGAIAAEIDKRQSDLDSRVFTEQEQREGKRGHLQKLIDNARYRLDQRAKLASQWESEKDRLSGITNEQAAEIEKKWAGNKAAQKAVAMLREIDDKSLDLLVEGGEITAEEAAVQRYTYPNHVPLMRENWADSKTQTGLAGTGPISRPLKRAGGSTKGVVNIFANVVDRHQAYISRKHKGVAGKALYEMVKANPDETKWSIEERPKKLTYDYEGNARFIYEDSTINREYQTIVKVNGKQHVITVPHDNPTMTRFIEAINRTPRELGPFMRGSAKIVRFMAGLNTSFAPEFLMTNFARDLQQAMVNLEDSEAKGLQKEVFKNIKAAIKGIYQSERGNESGEWAKIYAEYAKHGGKIGWMQPHENVAELAKSLEKELAYKEGKHPNIEKLRKLKSWVEAMNTAVENGVRLATYQALVKKGIDPKKAAYTAKTLTVDFTQHGTAGPAINSLYMFANAGIQGNVRTIKAIASSPKVRKLVTGIIGFGAMANIMGIMMGGDDDDGESYYDKLKHTNPDIFERNMVFMIPGTKGKYFKIPMPYGYNVFFVLGNEAASALRGKSPAESTARIGSALLGTLNPLQAATLLQTVMPTIGDPIAQWKENKAWHGGPLMPEKNPFGIPVPESERYFKSVNPVAKGIAQGLNSLTGGNKNKSGLIDVSPELFDMVFETYTGSAGRLVKDALSLPAAALSDDGVAANKVPFLRKVLGTYSDRTDRTIYRERSNEVGTLANRYKQSVDEKEKAELRKDPLFAMIPMHKQTDKQLLRLNKMLKLSEKMGNKEQAEKIRDRMTAIKIAYDKKYNELTK